MAEDPLSSVSNIYLLNTVYLRLWLDDKQHKVKVGKNKLKF